MPTPLRSLGLVGAALIMAGVAVIGVGFLNDAVAESSEISCNYSPPSSGCTSVYDNALNASTDTTYFIGAGFIVGGVGLGLVMVAAVGFMSRWPPAPRPGYLPPGPPPPLFPPGAP
jgi:hypothetical protein